MIKSLPLQVLTDASDFHMVMKLKRDQIMLSLYKAREESFREKAEELESDLYSYLCPSTSGSNSNLTVYFIGKSEKEVLERLFDVKTVADVLLG